MTEEASWSACQNRGEALALKGEACMTDGKDAALEPMQMAGRNSAVDRSSRITERSRQLPNRDNAVLPLRHFRQRHMCPSKVRRSFVPHSEPKDRRTSVSPPYPASFRPANTAGSS